MQCTAEQTLPACQAPLCRYPVAQPVQQRTRGPVRNQTPHSSRPKSQVQCAIVVTVLPPEASQVRRCAQFFPLFFQLSSNRPTHQAVSGASHLLENAVWYSGVSSHEYSAEAGTCRVAQFNAPWSIATSGTAPAGLGLVAASEMLRCRSLAQSTRREHATKSSAESLLLISPRSTKKEPPGSGAILSIRSQG